MKNILKLSALFSLCVMLVIGLAACGDDDNTGSIYENSAAGTYVLNGDQLTLIITSSDFGDCGPDIGTETWTVASITSTTMEWTDPI